MISNVTELVGSPGFRLVRSSENLYSLRDIISLIDPSLDYQSIGNVMTSYKASHGTFYENVSGYHRKMTCVRRCDFPEVIDFVTSEKTKGFVEGAKLKGAIIGSRTRSSRVRTTAPKVPVFSATIRGQLFEAYYQEDISEIIEKLLDYSSELEVKVENLEKIRKANLEESERDLNIARTAIRIARKNADNVQSLHRQMLAHNIKPRLRGNGVEAKYVNPMEKAA